MAESSGAGDGPQWRDAFGFEVKCQASEQPIEFGSRSGLNEELDAVPTLDARQRRRAGSEDSESERPRAGRLLVR